jgi:transcriptional regulator with XRE-family HTH domain
MPNRQQPGKKTKSSEAAAFGRAIAALRQQAGISQEEFADRCGSNRTFVSEIERGVKEPCLGSILRMASALRVSGADLIRDTERKMMPAQKR